MRTLRGKLLVGHDVIHGALWQVDDINDDVRTYAKFFNKRVRRRAEGDFDTFAIFIVDGPATFTINEMTFDVYYVLLSDGHLFALVTLKGELVR